MSIIKPLLDVLCVAAEEKNIVRILEPEKGGCE